MRSAKDLRSRFAVCALCLGVLLIPLTAAPADASPSTPLPVCAGAKDLVVDVSQDVRNEAFMPAKDGHLWATFSYTQHLRIWAVGARQYCVRKDFDAGTWKSNAGLSPGLSGTISAGLTGTFQSTQYWVFTGRLAPLAPTSGHLGEVDADCTAVGVCVDDSYLIVDNFYFSQGWEHCATLRATLEVDGGEHGHMSLSIEGQKFSATGDITG